MLKLPKRSLRSGAVTFFFCALIGAPACTQAPVRIFEEPVPIALTCVNIDWFEAGRIDGWDGAPFSKVEDHRERCSASPEAFNESLYENGYNAGVVEYCTPAIGLEAGKSGQEYRGVCPSHLEKEFLVHYQVGKRIRDLELENLDLESRIDTLTRLVRPEQSGGSIHSQIQQLRQRRAKNDSQITVLETRGPDEQL